MRAQKNCSHPTFQNKKAKGFCSQLDTLYFFSISEKSTICPPPPPNFPILMFKRRTHLGGVDLPWKVYNALHKIVINLPRFWSYTVKENYIGLVVSWHLSIHLSFYLSRCQIICLMPGPISCKIIQIPTILLGVRLIYIWFYRSNSITL